MRIAAIDLFCGCGGTTRGFLNAGINVIHGIDIDPSCRQTYERNNSPARFLCGDVFTMTDREILSGIDLGRKDKLLLSACAPCQPFSKQNHSGRLDRRRSLLSRFAEIVKGVRPDYVFVENVPGLQALRHNSPLHALLTVLEAKGYSYDFGILDAKSFGVPQTRNRLILVAAREGIISLPVPTHGLKTPLRPFRTVRDTIARYPRIRAGGKSEHVSNHVSRELSDLNIERIRHTPADGGDRREWPRRLWLKCHSKTQGHTDVYGRMHWDRPAPALTCRCTSLSNGRYGHPSQHRALSVREAAALQTFPDRYTFFGTLTEMSAQIGNAVPVMFAETLARVFVQHAGAQQ